jgi:hypothetical protein
MALPIIEEPMYGLMTFETAPTSTLTWVDRTANIIGTMSYDEGGRRSMPGANTVDVGTLNVSFKNLASVPNVGEYVRLRRTGTSQYVFTGFIQDVSQRIVFDSSVSYTTPITITSLFCVDWVAIASAWQVAGVGGRNPVYALTTSQYNESSRIRALNYSFDSSSATEIIKVTAEDGAFGSTNLEDTPVVASMAEHLDLMCRSTGAVWFASHTLPTNNTTGRDQLIRLNAAGSSGVSSSKTFTDVAGSAGQLHYTEIDFESSSQNISNVVVLNNSSLVRIVDSDVSILGGANKSNFIFVDLNTPRLGLLPDTTWRVEDATSITNFGQRFSNFETNLSSPVAFTTISSVNYYFQNLVSNPSAEYSDTGYSGSGAIRVRRRKPADEASPFTAYNGEWSIRARQISASTTGVITYSGGESDGIPVTAGRTYRVSGFGLRGTTSRTDLRAQIIIRWFDGDENLISQATGSNVALTTANTWFDLQHFATAPANTQRATFLISFNRSGGGNISAGDLYYLDAFSMHRTTATNTFGYIYFDGDSVKTGNDITIWTGQVGLSPSMLLTNNLRSRAEALVAAYSTTSIGATRIRWNAQEDLTAVSSISVGKTISIVYNGTTTTYRVIGIDGNVSPDRYIIDYYVVRT